VPRPLNIELGGTGRNDGRNLRGDAYIDVKDYGAVGTADPSNVTKDDIAFSAAAAAGKFVLVPEGTYYLSGASAGYIIKPGCTLQGVGEGKTIIYYSGAGNGIYMGASGTGVLAYDCTLRGITLICTNRASTVNGVYGENLVYFTMDDITSVGSGNPNSSTPADWVLKGSGFVLTNNSIIGRMNRCSARIWNYGAYFYTLGSSASAWSAAIEVSGQGEFANNMRGVVVGDPAIGYYSGAGVVFRDITFQGNYTTGMNINSGDNTVVDGCYFEGNANYDVVVGSPSGSPLPLCVKIINCRMDSENIGTTNYGTFPYLAKVYVDQGYLTVIENNDMAITSSIPLVLLASGSQHARIQKNRLTSLAASPISDGGTDTLTWGNDPEAPFVSVGSLTRALDGASASVSYTGLGFRPTSIEFFAAVDTAVEFSNGFSNVSGNRCVSSDGAGAKLSSSDAIRIIRAGAGNEQKAVVASFDQDGFTLTWTKVGAPPANTLTVNYVARR